MTPLPSSCNGAHYAAEAWATIAAANWHALATFTARLFPAGLSLLIDTGSTTTDIIPILDGSFEGPRQGPMVGSVQLEGLVEASPGGRYTRLRKSGS